MTEGWPDYGQLALQTHNFFSERNALLEFSLKIFQSLCNLFPGLEEPDGVTWLWEEIESISAFREEFVEQLSCREMTHLREFY